MSDSDGDGGTDYSGGADSVTETTTRSWFSRIGGALMGMVFGLLLIPGGIWLLAWNEGRAVQTARSLAEGGRVVLAAAPERVDPANEGRLIHLSGPLEGLAPLSDGAFGLRVDGATRLRRTVEMYQWKEESHSETRTRLGGGQETVTTYTYRRAWSDQPIDSGHFRQPGGHANPPMPYRGQVLVAEGARIGAFRLDRALLEQLGRFQPVPPEAVPPRGGAVPVEGGLFIGPDPAAPRIGDLRITWAVARTAEASVIGRQAGSGLAPFQTSAGDRLLMAADGRVPAAAMIQAAEEENRVLTWILRAVGALLVFVGAALLMQPAVVLASVLPFLGGLVGFGTMLVALLVTVVVAPVTIAIAWLWVRPVVGGLVLALGALLAFGVSRLMRARRAAAAAPGPGSAWGPAAAGPGRGGGGRSSFFPPGWTPPPPKR